MSEDFWDNKPSGDKSDYDGSRRFINNNLILQEQKSYERKY